MPKAFTEKGCIGFPLFKHCQTGDLSHAEWLADRAVSTNPNIDETVTEMLKKILPEIKFDPVKAI